MTASLVLVRHYRAVLLCAGSVSRDEGGRRCTELTQIFLSKDPPATQPAAVCSTGILEWTSGTLSPAASCWHINNTTDLIHHQIWDRVSAPAEQKAVPKGGRRGHQPYGRVGGPSSCKLPEIERSAKRVTSKTSIYICNSWSQHWYYDFHPPFMPLWQSDTGNMIARLQLECLLKVAAPVTCNPSNAVIQHHHALPAALSPRDGARIKPLSSCCHRCTTRTPGWSPELPKMDTACGQYARAFQCPAHLCLPHGNRLFVHIKDTDCKRKLWTNNGGEDLDWPFLLIPSSPQHYWGVYYFGFHLLTCTV